MRFLTKLVSLVQCSRFFVEFRVVLSIGKMKKSLQNLVSKAAGMSVIIKTQSRPGDIWFVVLGLGIEPGSPELAFCGILWLETALLTDPDHFRTWVAIVQICIMFLPCLFSYVSWPLGRAKVN